MRSGGSLESSRVDAYDSTIEWYILVRTLSIVANLSYIIYVEFIGTIRLASTVSSDILSFEYLTFEVLTVLLVRCCSRSTTIHYSPAL